MVNGKYGSNSTKQIWATSVPFGRHAVWLWPTFQHFIAARWVNSRWQQWYQRAFWSLSSRNAEEEEEGGERGGGEKGGGGRGGGRRIKRKKVCCCCCCWSVRLTGLRLTQSRAGFPLRFKPGFLLCSGLYFVPAELFQTPRWGCPAVQTVHQCCGVNLHISGWIVAVRLTGVSLRCRCRDAAQQQ